MVYTDETIAAAVAQGLAAARDPSHPDDPDLGPEKYARLSSDFRAGAWKHLREYSDLETRDWIRNSFMVARSLHSNFYEDEAAAEDITAGLRLCEELSDRLYELFWPERPTA